MQTEVELRRHALAAAAVLRSPLCQQLVPALMVDCLLEGHLFSLLPQQWRAFAASCEVSQLTAIALGQIPCDCPQPLAELIAALHAACLPRQNTSTDDIPIDPALRVGASPKKQHEVARMAALVSSVCRDRGIATVLDFGSGKGYLSSVLAVAHGMEVVAVEQQAHLNHTALQRATRATRYVAKRPDKFEGQPGQLRAVTAIVGEEGPQQVGGLSSDAPTLVAGLHTCGDLQVSVLRLFLQSAAKAVVCVGCCYHKHGQEPIQAYPLSDFVASLDVPLSDWSLELACHNAEEWVGTEETELWSHTQRAMLQILLAKRMDKSSLKLVRVGRMRLKGGERPGSGSDFECFARVCRAVFARALPAEPLPEEAELREVFDRYAPSHHAIVMLYALRTLLGAAIETLVVCDRALYVEEALAQGATDAAPPGNVWVQAVFDPEISPRAFAICACK